MLSALDVDPIHRPATPSAPSRSRAIIFVIDRGYLDLMKVFCHSLARLGTVNDIPIIVISEDSEVLDDAFVVRLADQRVPMEESVTRRLENAASRAYKRPGKEAWNRATFFKWAVFRDWGVDEALFLDCDMLAPRDFSDIFDASGADLVGAPQFQNDLYKNKDEVRHPPHELTRRIHDFVHFRAGSKISLNSGVMLMRRGVLSDQFLSELLRYTETAKAVNEQQFIAKFMHERRLGQLEYISPLYNFQASFLSRMPVLEQLQLLNEIRILHYAGRDKPWLRPPSRANFGSVMWRMASTEAEFFYADRGYEFERPRKKD